MKKQNNMQHLTASQSLALDYLKLKINVFITGSAGTGKSYLINYYRQNYNRKIPVLCSTGAAAVLVNGRTVHSFFSLGAMSESFEVIMERIYSNPKLLTKLQKLEEVIIDEVSMLGGKTFDMIDQVLQEVKNNEIPFGGVRLICVGDFHQIPPVEKIQGRPDYAFVCKSWRNARFFCFELKEFMRQTDKVFLSVLNNIRHGICTDHDDNYFKKCVLKKDEKFEGTRLFGKKDRVHEYNMQKLNEIKEAMYESWTNFSGEPSAVARLKKNLPIDDVVQLKTGAFVMIRINDNKTDQYVNGTLGHVLNFGFDYITIKKLNGDIVKMKKHRFELKDSNGDTIAEAMNYPLTLAWAITHHRSQGSTIDSCIVDLSQTWDGSMVYVALTRVKDVASLRLLGWDRSHVGASPLVKRYYAWIEQRRKEIERRPRPNQL